MKTNRRSMIEINERYISHPDFSRELSFRLVLKSFVTIILLYREIPRGSTRRNSSDTPRSGIRLLFLFFFFKLSLTNFFNAIIFQTSSYNFTRSFLVPSTCDRPNQRLILPTQEEFPPIPWRERRKRNKYPFSPSQLVR